MPLEGWIAAFRPSRSDTLIGRPEEEDRVGIFAEYVDRRMAFPALQEERKRQLATISDLRKRDVVVYAADLKKGDTPISIAYDDLLPFTDQLSNLTGSMVDVILETPGGSAEIAEDMVELLHDKFDDVSFIVPGTAKSAGTIMAMAGDDILLDRGSSLGPIDAQLTFQGKRFSAEAFLTGLEAIKEEVNAAGELNRAYIPILQNISPGDIQHARNGLTFGQELVTRWLVQYKFKNWQTHNSTGLPVSPEERLERAKDIARQLCDHGRWLSHGRSIKLDDLEAMRLQVTDYSADSKLYDAIRRYHILLQMTFDSAVYKVFETPTSQIYRMAQQAQQVALPLPLGAKVIAELECEKCHNHQKVQLNLAKGVPLEDGCVRYPSQGDELACQNCGQVMNLAGLRRQVEIQTKQEVVLNG